MNKKELYEEISEIMAPILDELMYKEFEAIKHCWKTSDKIANKVIDRWYEVRYFCSRSREDIKKLKKIGLY